MAGLWLTYLTDLRLVAASEALATHYSSPFRSVLRSCLHLFLAKPVHISLSRFLFQVFLSRPFSLWPCDIHCSACLAMLSSLHRSMCLIQFHFLLRSCFKTGCLLVSSTVPCWLFCLASVYSEFFSGIYWWTLESCLLSSVKKSKVSKYIYMRRKEIINVTNAPCTQMHKVRLLSQRSWISSLSLYFQISGNTWIVTVRWYWRIGLELVMAASFCCHTGT